MDFKTLNINKLLLGRIILVVLITIPHLSFSQLIKEYKKYADNYFRNGNYRLAKKNYALAFQNDSSDNYLLFRHAESARLYQNYSEAKNLYLRLIDRDFVGDYTVSYFYLGEVSKILEEYDDAFGFYSMYVSKSANRNSYEFWKAKQEVASIEEIKLLVHEQDSLIKEKHFDSPLNSDWSELAPSHYNNELFISTLRLKEDIEASNQQLALNRFHTLKFNRIGNFWSPQGKLELNLSKKQKKKRAHIGNYQKVDDSLSLFTVCSSKNSSELSCDIYSQIGINNATKLQGINFIGATSTQPYFAVLNDGRKVVFFSSDRSGGLGGMDLYMGVYDSGYVKDVINLGPTINTIGDEITPYFDSKKQQLFFSSDWHSGIGGMDVFYSNRKSDTSFSEVRNLGKPYNSSLNDIDFEWIESDKVGILASNRKGSFFINEEYCCHDIYQFNKMTIEEYQKELEKFEYVEDYAAIEPNYEDSVKKEPTEIKPTNFSQVYYSVTNSFIPLNHPTIYFDFNKFNLNKVAENTMDSVISEIKKLGIKRIELAAHTDGKGSSAYNLRLSKKRANFVKQYLIEKGISSEVISFGFYGEREPIASNTFEDGSDNPEGRKLNRRVELRYIRD